MTDPMAAVITDATRRDPYPMYDALRRSAPVHWDPPTNSWYVGRQADVARLLLDARLGAHEYPEWIHDLPEPGRSAVVPVEDHLARWPVFSDRPQQASLRRALQPALNRPAVEPLTAEITEMTRSLAAGIGAGPGDLLADFARPAARWTVGRLFGTTVEAADRFDEWTDAIIGYLGSTGIDLARAARAAPAIDEMTAFVERHLLADPRTPVTRRLAASLGSGGVELPDVVAMVAQLISGGIEPTATATCVLALRNGSGAAADVEAALRADPPFHLAPREAKTDFEYAGQRIRRGQRVVLILASAGRDDGAEGSGCPVAGSRPERRNTQFAFGRGRHYCLGAPLVRIQLTACGAAMQATGLTARVDRSRVEQKTDFGMTNLLRVPLNARPGHS